MEDRLREDLLPSWLYLDNVAVNYKLIDYLKPFWLQAPQGPNHNISCLSLSKNKRSEAVVNELVHHIDIVIIYQPIFKPEKKSNLKV